MEEGVTKGKQLNNLQTALLGILFVSSPIIVMMVIDAIK